MPITRDRIDKLREFGLSEYAARTYLALLDLGTAEARDISGISKVPASKIYRILEQLHEKGLVAILPEFPRKYAPIPFADYLQKIHDEHESAAASIERSMDELTEMFAVVGDVTASDRGTATLLRGRRNVLEKLAELLGTATRAVEFIATTGCLKRERFLPDLVRPLAERDVRVRLLLPDVPEAAEAARHLADMAEVRIRDPALPEAPGALVVVDGERALLVHFLPDDGHAYEGNDTGVATDQEGLVAVLAGLVDAPWKLSRPAAPADPDARGIPVRK